MCIFSCNVEDTDLVRMLTSPPRNYCIPMQSIHKYVRNYLQKSVIPFAIDYCMHNYAQAPILLQKSIADR